MATGIVGTLSGAGTLTYTPLSDAKVVICLTGAGSTTQASVNGIANALYVPAGNSLETTLWVGAGQTLTIVTGSTGTLVVSALES